MHRTPAGECVVVERVFPISHRHGRLALGEVLAAPRQALALLAKTPEGNELSLEQAVFLDTETTGLSGGTGTYVFLVGVGRFEQSRFVVRQVFMRHYGEEGALLDTLDEIAAGARALVTFNGRVFDWPLLETRYRMARRSRPPLAPLVHLDLLFPARRVWRGRLASCSLSQLEQAILGHQREEDVPGWAIPSLYFGYLRRGEAQPLRLVFQHNLHDVLSLATLLAKLGRLIGEPLEEVDDPDDLAAVARFHEEAGHAALAEACYQRALQLTRSGPRRAALLSRLAALHKRQGETARAVALWRELATLGPRGDVPPLVELAKYYEHREGDVGRALDLVQQAIALVQVRESAGRQTVPASVKLDLERRLARLARKAAARRALGGASAACRAGEYDAAVREPRGYSRIVVPPRAYPARPGG